MLKDLEVFSEILIDLLIAEGISFAPVTVMLTDCFECSVRSVASEAVIIKSMELLDSRSAGSRRNTCPVRLSICTTD